MNHEIDFSADDIYIRECGPLYSLSQPPFPIIEAKLCIECRWTPSCPHVWGMRPLQTGCLSEALTSSALTALTGSGRLFISPFSTESSLWLIWRLAARSIQPTAAETDTEGIWEPCARVCVCVCVFNKPLKWHKLTEVNYVFLNMVAICVLMNAAVQVN